MSTAVATHWADVRRRSGLSRERFAREVGLTPGAVWRVEAKGVLKPGELEKLLAAYPEGVTQDGQVLPHVTVPASAKVSIQLQAPPSEEDLEPQWLDAGPFTGEVTIPLERVSPTALSLIDGRARYSNSELYSFKDCRRRWWLSFYRGLVPVFESPTGARATGDRVHRALERWYAAPGVAKQDPRDALEQLIVADWTALVQTSGDEGVGLSTQEAFKKDADLQRAMVEGYVQWLAETGADAEYQVVEPEAYLEAELPEIPDTLIIGKIDVRVRRTSDGARMWLEHKTVGGFQQKLATLTLDEQVLHQTLLERLQPGDEPRVVGVLYNMIRRTKRTAAANPPFFQRVEVHHNDHELDSFRRRVVATIQDLRRARQALDDGDDHRSVVYPRPSGDCAWKCPFVQVCGMFDDGSRAEAALDAYFTKGDPYSYYVPRNPEV